jgi:hypothetical protein
MIEIDDLTLIHIAMNEDLDLDMRYQAVNELQYRRIPSEIQAEILYLSGLGKFIEEISFEVGFSEEQVMTFLNQMKAKHKSRFIEVPLARKSNRVRKWEKGHRYFRR